MKCTNCESENVLTGLKAYDQYKYTRTEFSIEKPKNPDALLFKGSSTIPLKASICADCGYAMFFGSKTDIKKFKKEQNDKK